MTVVAIAKDQPGHIWADFYFDTPEEALELLRSFSFEYAEGFDLYYLTPAVVPPAAESTSLDEVLRDPGKYPVANRLELPDPTPIERLADALTQLVNALLPITQAYAATLESAVDQDDDDDGNNDDVLSWGDKKSRR